MDEEGEPPGFRGLVDSGLGRFPSKEKGRGQKIPRLLSQFLFLLHSIKYICLYTLTYPCAAFPKHLWRGPGVTDLSFQCGLLIEFDTTLSSIERSDLQII